MKTQGPKQALNKHGFDVAFGGARVTKRNLVRKNVFILSVIKIIAGPQMSAPRVMEYL
jgi:hypothetical protein